MNPGYSPRVVLARPRPARHRRGIKPALERFEDRMLLSHASPVAVAGQVHALAQQAPARATPARNVIIFVADGLRPGAVNPTDAPTLTALRKLGVNFQNSHAIFPTFTTPNAAAIATGHYPGDTGDYSNTIYSGYPVLGGTNTPFLENNGVLSDVDEHFGGSFLDEATLLATARQQGYNTAAVGKVGPALIQDVTQGNTVNGSAPIPSTVVVDDSTGKAGGLPLDPNIYLRLVQAGVGVTAPDRSNGTPSTSTINLNNGNSGTNTTPGTLAANTVQQRYFADATTRAILPYFQATGKPFALVYWSRDPDGTQHNQGDSLNSLTPGINGPTSRAAVRNADNNLKQIYDYLKANPRLARNTDIFVTSDHGFATISKHEIDAQGNVTHAYASTLTYPGVNPGFLPAGFVAIDVAHALNLPIYDPDVTASNRTSYTPVDPTRGQRPRNGDALIGGTGTIANPNPTVVVAANGGSDLIYVPNRDPKVVAQVVDFLSRQDYTSGLFVDDAFGPIPGSLPLSSINLKGSSKLPTPSIVINFKTFSTNPADPLGSAVEIADTGLQEGQGMHGTFGRQDTFNNMLAIGPDFKRGFRDTAPASNADVAFTLAKVLGFNLAGTGNLTGRVLTESLKGGKAVKATTGIMTGAPSAVGTATQLNYQAVGNTLYFDAAGYAGRTVGLDTIATPSTPVRKAGAKKR